MNGQIDGVSSAEEIWSRFVQSRVIHTQRSSYHGQPDAIAQARQTVDDELAAMHMAMCSLRTYRNTLAPISGLPSEIFAFILELHVIDQPPSKRGFGEDVCGDLGWIRVTHVCRLWRDMALHHPSLWRNITTELGLSWLELMLNRAKSVPLSYSHLHCEEDSERFLACVLPHLLSRIRSFSISDEFFAVNIAIQLLRSPARMLRSLELIADHGSITLPEDIFENDAPLLCRLHLSGINISWSAPILHSLEHLRLEHHRYHEEDSAAISSFRDFFYTIERMPSLRTLHLAYILPSRPANHSADDCTAQVPHLQSLALIDYGDKCLDVLERLHIPPSCRLQLGCAYDFLTIPEEDLEDTGEDIPAFRVPEFFPRLCRYFPANMDPFHTLSVFCNDDGDTIGLKLWRKSSVANSSVFHPADDPDLFISVCPPTEHMHLLQHIEAICYMLPLDNIRVIIINIQECDLLLDDYDWKFLFRTHCPQVSSAFVDDHSSASGLCEAMRLSDDKAVQQGGGQDSASTQDQAFLPNLELLEVESIDFRPCYTVLNGKRKVLKAHQLYVDTFTQRRMMGKAVSTIRLGKGCVIDAARLDALKAVIHVEWEADAVQEIPKAPYGFPEGIVYPDYIMNPEQEE